VRLTFVKFGIEVLNIKFLRISSLSSPYILLMYSLIPLFLDTHICIFLNSFACPLKPHVFSLIQLKIGLTFPIPILVSYPRHTHESKYNRYPSIIRASIFSQLFPCLFNNQFYSLTYYIHTPTHNNMNYCTWKLHTQSFPTFHLTSKSNQ